MFRKMPVILLTILLSVFFIDPIIPVPLKAHLFAISMLFKSVIVFGLPILIFMLLFKTIAQLSKGATKMLLFILVAMCISNFISTMISYQVGSAIYNLDLSITLPHEETGLEAAWDLTLPKLIANDRAMFSGIFLGLFASLFFPAFAHKAAGYFEKWVGAILKSLTLIIPVFITGFAIKLVHDKTLHSIVQNYLFIFLLVALSVFAYITLLYLLSNSFRFKSALENLKNMLPAALTGFSSMSSAAAMPLTIMGAEKNSSYPTLTRLAIPVTVNTHLIGDCFAIPIFAFAVMKNFGVAEPAFYSYLVFAFFFVLAKFSVAAIPGGGIIVMLPILESQLGFTGEMSSLITALYILFDPVITCANVTGNGAFAQVLNKIHGLIQQKPIPILAKD